MSRQMTCKTSSGHQQDGITRSQFPLSPFKAKWIESCRGKDLHQIVVDEAIPSLARVCEIRDSQDTPPQTALQAALALLNKVLPDKVERTDLTVSLDLNKLIEAYQGINRPLSTDPQVIDTTEDLK